MKTLFIILVICMISTTALAQAPKKKVTEPKPATQISQPEPKPPIQTTSQPQLWEAEPESLLGIKLGVPVSESYPKCNDNERWDRSQFGATCWVSLFSDTIEIVRPPEIGLRIWSVMGIPIGGLIEKVFFTFDHAYYREMAELLKSKYGPPTTEKIVTLQNRMGASFDSLQLIWVGRNLTLEYHSRATKIDEGAVIITTKKYSESKKINTEPYKGNL